MASKREPPSFSYSSYSDSDEFLANSDSGSWRKQPKKSSKAAVKRTAKPKAKPRPPPIDAENEIVVIDDDSDEASAPVPKPKPKPKSRPKPSGAVRKALSALALGYPDPNEEYEADAQPPDHYEASPSLDESHEEVEVISTPEVSKKRKRAPESLVEILSSSLSPQPQLHEMSLPKPKRPKHDDPSPMLTPEFASPNLSPKATKLPPPKVSPPSPVARAPPPKKAAAPPPAPTPDSPPAPLPAAKPPPPKAAGPKPAKPKVESAPLAPRNDSPPRKGHLGGGGLNLPKLVRPVGLSRPTLSLHGGKKK